MHVTLILFNKPYGVLSQFTDRAGRKTLADYIPVRGVYAAGRLDQDTEGLLVLTDDGTLQQRITAPAHRQAKTYWVQVEGTPSEAALSVLRTGVLLKDGHTAPAEAHCIPEPTLPTRVPPIRIRRHIPTTWLQLTITEGRNRQIRRMTAAVGLPTLRLVRIAVGPWTLGDLEPGCWREATAQI